MEKEIWKDVVGFEDYFQISNFGRVCSKRTEKILKQGSSYNGYPVISSKIGGRNGIAICKKVHRWVAEVFIENIHDKPYINHKDGVKTNNHYTNLEWCNASENICHAFDNNLNTQKKGEDAHRASLTQDDVNYIRENYIHGDRKFGQSALGRKFSVHHVTIRDIILNKTWKI